MSLPSVSSGSENVNDFLLDQAQKQVSSVVFTPGLEEPASKKQKLSLDPPADATRVSVVFTNTITARITPAFPPPSPAKNVTSTLHHISETAILKAFTTTLHEHFSTSRRTLSFEHPPTVVYSGTYLSMERTFCVFARNEHARNEQCSRVGALSLLSNSGKKYNLLLSSDFWSWYFDDRTPNSPEEIVEKMNTLTNLKSLGVEAKCKNIDILEPKELYENLLSLGGSCMSYVSCKTDNRVPVRTWMVIDNFTGMFVNEKLEIFMDFRLPYTGEAYSSAMSKLSNVSWGKDLPFIYISPIAKTAAQEK